MRRLVLPLACLVLVAASLAGAYRSAEGSASGGRDVGGAAATPILSARRTPDLVEQVAAAGILTGQLNDVVARSGPSTCLVVRSGARDLYSHLPDTPVTPASNEKLLTAFAALKVFGPDHRLQTRVMATTHPDAAGVVHGDVWLVGGGDPLLTTESYRAILADRSLATSLESLADALVKAGVRRIDGHLIGDESRYDGQRVVPSWPARYVSDHESGPLSALTVNDGWASFPTRGPGAAAPVKAAPDPAKMAADALALLLQQRGVTVGGGTASGPAPATAGELTHLDSLPLSAIVHEMLSQSDNQTAELLLKELGHSAGVGPGTTAAGITVLQRALDAAHLSRAGTVQVDGSGLDPGNRVTCRLLISLLDAAGPSSSLAAGLAVAATSGTLKGRLGHTPAAGRIRAKTGSLSTVSALSGFVTTVQRQTLTFAFVTNGRPVPYAQTVAENDLGLDLVAYPPGIALRSLVPKPARLRAQPG